MKKPAGKKKRSFRKRPSTSIRSIKKVFLKLRSKISHNPLEIKKIEELDSPTYYGDNRIVLMVKDPWWLFAYWEVTSGRRKEILQTIQNQGLHPEKTVLRVYDVTDTTLSHCHSFFDIELNYFVSNWYIDVGIPNRQWVVELGIRTLEGRFFALVKSNTVRTPRFGVSDVLDEEWMIPDDLFWKLFGLSGGFGARPSSPAIGEFHSQATASTAPLSVRP